MALYSAPEAITEHLSKQSASRLLYDKSLEQYWSAKNGFHEEAKQLIGEWVIGRVLFHWTGSIQALPQYNEIAWTKSICSGAYKRHESETTQRLAALAGRQQRQNDACTTS